MSRAVQMAVLACALATVVKARPAPSYLQPKGKASNPSRNAAKRERRAARGKR